MDSEDDEEDLGSKHEVLGKVMIKQETATDDGEEEIVDVTANDALATSTLEYLSRIPLGVCHQRCCSKRRRGR